MIRLPDMLRRRPSLLRRAHKSRFVSDVALLAGGTGLAQLIAIAFSPIITRLYGPEAFGILGVFTALVAMIAPVSTVTYGSAIVLPATDGDARTLARLSLRIAVVVAGLSIVVFTVFRRSIALAMGSPETAPYLMLVPLVLLFRSVEQVLKEWLIRKRRFRSISRVAIVQAGATGASKSGVGLIAATAPVLLVLNALGHLFHVGMLWKAARHSFRGEEDSCGRALEGEPAASFRDVAYTYRDYPLYRAPRVLGNSISRSLPTLMLAGFFGAEPVGFYALSQRVLKVPVQIVSQSVGQALLPRIVETAHRGTSLRPYLLRATAGLALLGAMPFALVVVFAPQVFSVVFGAEWDAAGQYARWLALWLYSVFINAPSVQAIPILDLQKPMLIYETLAIGLRVGALAYGALVLASDLAAIALYSTIGVLYNFGLIGWVLLRSGSRLREGMGGAT